MFLYKSIKIPLIVFLMTIFLSLSNAEDINSNDIDIINNTDDNYMTTFSLLRDETGTILQSDYLNFLRLSILEQPEYSFSVSTVIEKDMLVKYENRTRYPDLSLRVINDKNT